MGDAQRHAFRVDVRVPDQVGRIERVGHPPAGQGDPRHRLVAKVGLVDPDRILAEIVAQGLVGRHRAVVAARRQDDAHEDLRGQLGVDAQTRPVPVAVPVGGGVQQGEALGGLHAARLVDGVGVREERVVALVEIVALEAEAEVAGQADAVQPFGHGVGRDPPLGARLGHDLGADLVADLVADQFGDVGDIDRRRRGGRRGLDPKGRGLAGAVQKRLGAIRRNDPLLDQQLK